MIASKNFGGMDNPEYFLMSASLDGVRAKLGRPPLPPPNDSHTPSVAASEAKIVSKGINIAGRVSKFEKFAKECNQSASSESLENQLWYYKDGVRSRSASNSKRTKVDVNAITRSKSVTSSDLVFPNVSLVRISSSEIQVPKSPVLVHRNSFEKHQEKARESSSQKLTVKRDSAQEQNGDSSEPGQPPQRPPRKDPRLGSCTSKSERPIPPPRTKSPAQKKEALQRHQKIMGKRANSEEDVKSDPDRGISELKRQFFEQPTLSSSPLSSTSFSSLSAPQVMEDSQYHHHHQQQHQQQHQHHRLDRKGRIRLEELLDFCADYERQIDAEQQVLLEAVEAWPHPPSASAHPTPAPASPSVFRSSMSVQLRQNSKKDARCPVPVLARPCMNNVPNNSGAGVRTDGTSEISGPANGQPEVNTTITTTGASLSNAHHVNSPNVNGTSTVPPSSISPVTPNRIKTNGSLPRDSRMSSPGPKGVGGPVPPTSPYLTAPESELQRVFNFDAYHTNLSNGSSSPSDTLNLSGQVSSLPRHMNGNQHQHYVNFLPNGGQPHHSYLTMPQSPRSRIRTFTQNGSGQTTPSGSSSAETVREMTMDDYQGGGEDIFATSKTKEQLYMEAKDILAMVSNGSNSGKRFPPDYVNLAAGGISPGSTGPRRPPKSKHDRDPNSPTTQGSHDHPKLPSQEATNRLLIGTTMLNGNRKSPARAFSPEREIIQNSLATLRVEKESQITLVSSLKRRLTDLEMKEEDDIRELEMERSLLIAEWEQETHALNKIKTSLSDLSKLEEKLTRTLNIWREESNKDIEESRSKLQNADDEFQRLDELFQQLRGSGTEEENDILEQLKRQHEVLDIERKIFEDKEFEFMEKDAKREEEKENLSKEISDLTSAMKKHEKQLQNVEEQQRKILMTVRRETRTLEGQRQSLIKQLEMERAKLSSIDERISKINTHTNYTHQKPPVQRSKFIGSSHSRDLSKIPNIDSDQSDSDDANEVNHLHKSLSRLAMLDKSLEADLHRISVFEEDCSNGYNAYLSSPSSKSANNLRVPISQSRSDSAKSNKASTKGGQSLNSIGGSQDSVTGSFSDIHTESLSGDESSRTKNSPSPISERAETSSSSSTTRNISQNHRSKSSASSVSNPSTTTPGNGQSYHHSHHHQQQQHRHDNGHHHQVIIPRSGNSDFSEVSSITNGSRPLSEVSSFWDDTDMPIEVKRRQNKATQQRPLTRYLPVRNEHFDLRQHIETAGHQIELCSHLILNASSCRGYLHKLGAKFKTWNKRWFVFDRHKRTLIYYHDKTETKAKGGIYFQAIEDVYIDHQNQVKSPNSKVTFCMKTADRPYYLMAPTPEAMRVWVDVIFTGAEGYQEFMNQ